MKLEVFFDYTCPYCYLGLHELNQILPDYPNLSVEWCPCEIHPQSEPRVSGWDASGEWFVELKPRLERAGLSIKRPFEPGNYSYLAIQGLFWLEEQGADIKRYNDAVYAAFFCESKDIENIDVLSDCAVSAGADAESFCRALNLEIYKERRLRLNKYGWEENALDSVPSFRLGNARLNAVYSVGVLREQIAEFLEKHA
ncbi:putative DsbA family dithiol-disulfide isomerase [Anaerotaenia torta]|uniref:DsbA family oxidoreductase n=1 Tax=Anaerotaenia torta TaxID=433293 RepID=UPI003D1F75A3